jgi:nucleoid-associated protein YgaU
MFTLFGCRSHAPADPAMIPEQPQGADRTDGATKPVAGSSWKEAGEASAPGAQAMAIPATPTARTHTVRKGDTIYSLARLYYGGDVHRWHTIYDANRDKVANPNQLKIGQVLVIPG